MVTKHITKKINASLAPIFTEFMMKNNLSRVQMASYCGLSVETLNYIQENPARIPCNMLHKVIDKMDFGSQLEVQCALYNTQNEILRIRKNWGWLIRAEHWIGRHTKDLFSAIPTSVFRSVGEILRIDRTL